MTFGTLIKEIEEFGGYSAKVYWSVSKQVFFVKVFYGSTESEEDYRADFKTRTDAIDYADRIVYNNGIENHLGV